MVATQLRMPFSFCWWNLLHDYQFMWCLNIRRYPAIKKSLLSLTRPIIFRFLLFHLKVQVLNSEMALPDQMCQVC